jgi:hypothetical protein
VKVATIGFRMLADYSVGLKDCQQAFWRLCRGRLLSYPVFMPKPSTHRMHDPGSIVLHIWPKVFTDNEMSQIKYNYYISNVSKDYDDSQ